jgi:hypothetical protein
MGKVTSDISVSIDGFVSGEVTASEFAFRQPEPT